MPFVVIIHQFRRLMVGSKQYYHVRAIIQQCWRDTSNFKTDETPCATPKTLCSPAGGFSLLLHRLRLLKFR